MRVAVALLFITLVAVASAAKYYVANGGNDGAAGTSSKTAFATLQKAAAVVSPGDSILLANGHTFDTAAGVYFSRSGSAGHPINIMPASKKGKKPVIMNSAAQADTSHSWCALCLQADYYKVSGIMIKSAPNAGIWIGPGHHHNQFSKIEITAVGLGIVMEGDYNIITKSKIHNLIMVVDSNNGGVDDYGATAIQFTGAGNEASYNKITSNRQHSYDFGTDGGALEVFGAVSNSYFHHNWCENNDDYWETGAAPGSSVTVSNVVIAYNVFINSVTAGWHYKGEFAVNVVGFYVVNNVFYDTSSGSGKQMFYGVAEAPNPSQIIIMNNIMYSTTHSAVTDSEAFTHKNNIVKFSNGAKLSGESTADPQWVKPGKDFHLKPGSPANDAGAKFKPKGVKADKKDYYGNKLKGKTSIGVAEGKGGSGKKTKAGSETPAEKKAPIVPITGAAILNSINNARLARGVAALKSSNKLKNIAKKHAVYMAAHKDATASPALAGRPEVKKNYFPWKQLGENYAAVNPSIAADQLVNNWASDPKFMSNMFSAAMTDFACAIKGAGKKYYVSCEFGTIKPKKAKKPKSIEEASASGDLPPVDLMSEGTSSSETSAEIQCPEFDTATQSSDLSSSDMTIYESNCKQILCSAVDDDTTWNPRRCAMSDRCLACTTDCQPTTTCAANKQTCGTLFDGCKVVNCGDCASGEVCQQQSDVSYKCAATTCPAGCPNNAKCVKGECVCPAGSYVDENECVPNVVLSDTPSDELASFKLYGEGEWTINYENDIGQFEDLVNGTIVEHDEEEEADELEGPTGIAQNGLEGGLALWESSAKVPAADVLVLSASVMLHPGNAYASLVFNAQDEDNYLYFKVNAAGELYFGAIKEGQVGANSKIGSVEVNMTDPEWAQMVVVARGDVFELFYNGARYPKKTILRVADSKQGMVGVYADGPAQFGDLKYRSRVLYKVYDPICDVEGIEERVSWALGIDKDQITVSCPDIEYRKREGAVAEVYVEGSLDYAAESLGSDMSTYASTADASFAQNTLSVSAVEAAADVAADAAVAEIIVEVVAITAGAAIGAGAIAGIAIAGGVAAAAATTGAVVVVKKRRQNVGKREVELGSTDEKKRPVGAGANVFELDPNNHSSITGRSPLHTAQV